MTNKLLHQHPISFVFYSIYIQIWENFIQTALRNHWKPHLLWRILYIPRRFGHRNVGRQHCHHRQRIRGLSCLLSVTSLRLVTERTCSHICDIQGWNIQRKYIWKFTLGNGALAVLCGIAKQFTDVISLCNTNSISKLWFKQDDYRNNTLVPSWLK